MKRYYCEGHEMEAGMVECEHGPYVEYEDVERLLKAAEKLLLMDAQYDDLGYEREGKEWDRAMADLWRETFPSNTEVMREDNNE